MREESTARTESDFDPAESLRQCWCDGERPNVADFVAAVRIASPESLAAVLRVDQHQRWLLGERVQAEFYLERFPSVAHDAEAAIDLIFGEYLMREQAGECPQASEFQTRFPQFAEMIDSQIELHEALSVEPGWLRHYFEDDSRSEVKTLACEDLKPRIAGYEILAELGRGSSGIVYKATHARLKRPVALKVLHESNRGRERRVERFRAEAEAIARVNHSNIVQIYDAGEQDGRPYIVLEYVEGTSLDRVCGQPQPPRDSAVLIRTLALAVQCAHDHGILHRDLKPANVLIQSIPSSTEQQQIQLDVVVGDAHSRWWLDPNRSILKVTDFGLVKFLGSEPKHAPSFTGDGDMVGTPSYMSPEQASGRWQDLGAPADIYAMGAILYELLTGRPPFIGRTLLEVLEQLRRDEPPRPSMLLKGVPRDLETICLRCLEKEPERRYRSAAALADDLNRFLTHRPILARRIGHSERVVRWCRRNRATACALAMLMLVCFAGASGILWQWRKAVDAGRTAEYQAAKLRSDERRLREAFELTEIARVHGQRGGWDDAMAAYSAAIQLRPDVADFVEERGAQYLKLNLIEPAANDIQRSIELRKPISSLQWRRHALLRLSTSDPIGYRRACGEMAKLFSTSGHADELFEWVRTCSVAADSGIDPSASTATAEAMIDRQSDTLALYTLGLASYRDGRWEETLAACRRSIDADGELQGLNHSLVAMAAHQLGDSALAQRSLSQAADQYETWMLAMYQTTDEGWTAHQGALAHWPIDPCDWLEFSLLYREAQELIGDPRPADPRLQVIRARSYAALRRPKEAVESYQRARQLAPSDPRIEFEWHRARAYLNITEHHYREAAQQYSLASQFSPSDSDLWRYRAMAFLCAGDLESYQSTCRQFVLRFTDTDSAHDAAALVEVCVCRDDALDDWESLIPLAQLARDFMPDSKRFFAAAQYRAGRYEQTVQNLTDLQVYCRLRAMDLFFLAMAQQKLGQTVDANHSFDCAIAWIDEANSNPSGIRGARPIAAWAAWVERPETSFLRSEAETLLGRSKSLHH